MSSPRRVEARVMLCSEAFMDAFALQTKDGSLIATSSALLVENADGEPESILGCLRAVGLSVRTTVVQTLADFMEAVSSREFSIVLCGSRLRGFTPMDAFQVLQKTGKYTPFVLLGDEVDEDFMAECLNQGVTDYVLRSHLRRLPMALNRAIETSELRQTQEGLRGALRSVETQNRELIENSAYGIFRASPAGFFLAANSALLQILACPSLEALQTLHLATDVFRFPEHYVKLLASSRESGLVHSAETEWRRKDGGFVAVKLHLRYIPAVGGLDHIEGMAEDVTELRALQQQLLHAQKFEAIGQLAGGIAHDFNNVVGAILGWAELGFEQNQSLPEVSARFQRIREQAGRAASLTRELLAFTQYQELCAKDWASPSAQVPQPSSLTGTETILVVEGHGSIREVLRQSLGSLGYRALCAANGDEGLQLCRDDTPALAILDVFTPCWCGHATVARLRARFPNIPVVFTSGSFRAVDGLPCGIANSFYLLKPYSPTALSCLVRRILDSRTSVEVLCPGHYRILLKMLKGHHQVPNRRFGVLNRFIPLDRYCYAFFN